MRLDPNIEIKGAFVGPRRLLDEEFDEKLYALQAACSAVGINLRIGTTIRGPIKQAEMFCRSRSVEEVGALVAQLSVSAPRIASLMRPDMCELGPQVTRSAPGQSWHQYGEAADFSCYVDGKLIWDGSTAKTVASMAAECGLVSPLTWHYHRRPWHLQLHKEESPLLRRGFMDSWSAVEEEMLRRYEL